MQRSVSGARILLLVLFLAGCSTACSEGDRRPNVLFVLVDTLRKDHLQLYGYERPTSANINSLAKSGWVFDNHIASAAQTVPSVLSMMLSLHPAEHGFLHLSLGHFGKNRPLYPDHFLFLPEVFSNAGYATAGFVGNPFLQRENGFSQGFDTFIYSQFRAESLTRPCAEWIKEHAQDGERPFFAYIHYLDVHWPYRFTKEYRDRFPRFPGGRPFNKNGPVEGLSPEDFASTIAAYDSAITFVDDQIGQLLDTLKMLGVHDDTIVVVTSDHGDEFLEHGGMGHGTSVYGELIRVPLVIAFPDKLEVGRRIDYLTHHIDLGPTLLELAGIEKPAQFRGDSLTVPAPRVFAENGPWRTVYAEGRKLIINPKADLVELFDARDELDQQPLTEASSETALLRHLAWYRRLKETSRAAAGTAHPDEPWSEKEQAQLKALGYLD